MSGTMARQGGPVQLEQSEMRLALHMTRMAKGGYLHAAIEETQFLLQKFRAKVRGEKMRGVEFPGHKDVAAAKQRHPATLQENQTDGCLPCQHGTAQYRIPRPPGDAMAQVHLHQSDPDSQHQNRHHILRKCRFFQQVTMRRLTYPKSK